MVKYWDKYTEMHGQQNVKNYKQKLHQTYLFRYKQSIYQTNNAIWHGVATHFVNDSREYNSSVFRVKIRTHLQ